MKRDRWGYKKTAVLLVFMLLLASIHAYSSASRVDETPERILSSWVYIPAIQGSTGKLVNTTVQIVYPGRGNITITTTQNFASVSKLTKLSMELAVKTSSLMAGYSWRGLDAFITLDIDSDVTGPSGGFAVALLTFAMLETKSNISLRNLSITGAITPSGLSWRVGGIAEKCIASNRESSKLMVPVANYMDVPPNCDAIVVSGLLNATSALGLLYVPVNHVNVTPIVSPTLESLLKNLYENITIATEELLSKLPPPLRAEVYGEVESLLEEAEKVVDGNPYAATSLAFNGYLITLQAYYNYNVSRNDRVYVDRVLQSLKDRASSLEATLSSLPAEGSQVYIELLSLSYARLADAIYNIGVLEKNINVLTSTETASRLAYINGRLDSVTYWLRLAIHLREEGLFLSRHVLSDILIHMRDYTLTASNYSIELVEYVVANYPLDEKTKTYLLSISSELKNLMLQAEAEYARGNVIAALGYYRECLSKSLDVMARLITSGDASNARAYYEELRKLWILLTSRAFLHGLHSSVSTLYYMFSEYKAASNDYWSALELMEEAVLSAMLWNLATLKYIAIPIDVSNAQGEEIEIEQFIAFIAWSSLLLVTGLIGGIAISVVVTYIAMKRTRTA